MKNESVVMGVRAPKSLRNRIVAEQQRIAELTGIKPSLNDVMRMLLESGLESDFPFRRT